MSEEYFNEIRIHRERYQYLLSKKANHKCLKDLCNEKSISSHSISENTLNRISENGHVVCPTFNIQNIGRSESDLYNLAFPNIAIEEIGVSKAGVYKGFCVFHDNEIFKPIDSHGIITHRDVFLQLYRTSCKFYFQNIQVSKSEMEVFGYEYSSNSTFETNMELSLEYIIVYLENMLTDFPELEVSLNLNYNLILILNPFNKQFNSEFRIALIRISPIFNFALEKDFTLHLNGMFHHCIIILVPGANYSTLQVLCHNDVLNQICTKWRTEIDLLNFLESVLIQDSIFYLHPNVIRKWAKQKHDTITNDFFFFHERKFLQEYDISIFDDIRIVLIENESDQIKKKEMDKMEYLPIRKEFCKRNNEMTRFIIKQRQDKIRHLGYVPKNSYPIGSLIID